jgi:hypothetical protein
MLERLCAEAGFEPDIAYVLRDVTVARAFVAAGLCVSLMPELTLPEPRSDIAVRPIRDVDPFRSIYAAWLRGRRVASVAPMVRYLSDAATARLGDPGGASRHADAARRRSADRPVEGSQWRFRPLSPLTVRFRVEPSGGAST